MTLKLIEGHTVCGPKYTRKLRALWGGGVRTYPNDLPEQTKHQVRLAGVEVVGTDVDDVAADGAR